MRLCKRPFLHFYLFSVHMLILLKLNWTRNMCWSHFRSENGTKSIDVTVPDTITSWYASAFGMSKLAGLGVADATMIRVFQPFFISLVLPYSVIRGEEVTVPAVLFNYMEDSCLSVCSPYIFMFSSKTLRNLYSREWILCKRLKTPR